MRFLSKTPTLSLNAAFKKQKPLRNEFDTFKTELIALLDSIDGKESEEFHKNLAIRFLTNAFYKDTNFINTKEKKDLVIHTGKDNKTPVGVIIEFKSPKGNESEMFSLQKPQSKSLIQLILYYFEERCKANNTEIKHLVITNIYEWFLFDANEFDKHIYRNTKIKKLYDTFESDSKDKPFFYEELKKLLPEIEEELTCTHFDIRTYEKNIRNEDKEDDNQLRFLYKVLSPFHLLKIPFANDSNSLDKVFYDELLHIIGLGETKDGGKKIIQRLPEGSRNAGSLLENTITQLDSHDKLSRLPQPSQYGVTHQERLFTVALELVITWMNRVLFLKLLEAQLLTYHKGNKAYSFLSKEKISDYDELDKLFFRVLAKKVDERDPKINELFGLVPYLNSSLFEPTDMEHQTLFINGLENDIKLPLHRNTVLKDEKGKRRTDSQESITYLFEYLNAYDFSSDSSGEIQEDNKTLINASVLGLIFEKINGYKDGSFFTPGFITMYMCRETIRRAVIQKFNETKNWKCQNINELHSKIEDKKEANAIVNSLRLCDPAVGSGHFLVSALNEIIAIKNDLVILFDREGKSLKDYYVKVENDELAVEDKDTGKPFEYNPNNKESQRVQEALFHEKQTIIENCLFGVDINPNSVKICRLRLWVELLKNAYYRNYKGKNELETLPNIDINIKCGNSLISRFGLDEDLKQALKNQKGKLDIERYKGAVQTYRHANSKEQKREMESLIVEIKESFKTEITKEDKTSLSKARGEVTKIQSEINTLEQWNEKVPKELKFKLEDALKKLAKLEKGKDDILNNRFYDDNNAFEWRFEFPEVLDNEGAFVGFDVVIGNPPYIAGKDLPESFKDFLKLRFKYLIGKFDLYLCFIEQSVNILNGNNNFCLIIPNTFLANENAKLIRDFLINNHMLKSVSVFDDTVFTEAFVESLILQIDSINKTSNLVIQDKHFNFIRNAPYEELKGSLDSRIQVLNNVHDDKIISKVEKTSIKLGEIVDLCIGIQLGGEGDSKDFKAKYISKEKTTDDYKKMLDGKDFEFFNIKWSGSYIKYGDWLHRKRDEKYFLNPKIMIRQIGETPFATIDFDGFYTLNTIYNGIISDNKFDIKYVFALLTCSLNKFIWKRRFSDGKSLFPKVKKSQLVEIPISPIGKEKQIPIIEKVDQILTQKKPNPTADTTALEKEIDALVYELYGLTEEEIKIVEGV